MNLSSAARPGLPIEQLLFLQESVSASAALDAADRLGVLARLRAGPITSSMLARDCAIGERGARALLAALAGLGLAEVDGDGLYCASDLIRWTALRIACKSTCLGAGHYAGATREET